MIIKTKILIGILVIVILAAGGWWIWESQTIEGPKGICGPKGMGANYGVSYCDKSCNTDNDCKFACGCGAINKNEICHDEGIIYDCVDREAKCEKGKCVIGEEILSAEVIIITDKTEYEQGEKIKITIKNNLNKSADIFYQIEKITEEKIIPIRIRSQECPPKEPLELPIEILPEPLPANSAKEFLWDQKDICTGIQQTGGTYKVKAGITVKEYEDHTVIGEEKFTIYSNEFRIKEKKEIPRDTKIKEWMAIWKEFVLSSQNISENYFNDHISVESFDTSEWMQGTSFRINYNINIDWASVKSCDHFLIRRKGETEYLTKEEIYSIPTYEGGLKDRVLLSNGCSNSKKLKEFGEIITQSQVTPKIRKCHSSIIWSPEKSVILTNKGKLVVNAYETIDEEQNKCKFASLDLETGELLQCENTVCWVD